MDLAISFFRHEILKIFEENRSKQGTPTFRQKKTAIKNILLEEQFSSKFHSL